MRKTGLIFTILLLLYSCSSPTEREHQGWQKTWLQADDVIKSSATTANITEYLGACDAFSSFLGKRLSLDTAPRPFFLDPLSAPTAQALTAWSEAKDEWQTDKSSIRPFQLFFDLEDLAAARRRLEAKDYLVEVFPVQRLLPWLNLQTPLRLDWQKRPLAFSAEILAYNALLETADTSDQEAFVEKTVGDFLVARYGANSLELEAFLSRRADERTLQALIGQLAQALNSAIDTTARNSYLALWLAEYRQNYANRFQTNLYQNIDEKWLSPGRILLISEGWFPD